jgi:release factor glutamine methyltransferase
MRQAADFLKPGGTLLFEIGLGQDRLVTQLFARAGAYEPATTRCNGQGEARVVVARKARAGQPS